MIALVDMELNFNFDIESIFGNNIDEDLEQIQKQLIGINNKLENILNNQKLILDKLDLLPIIIREEQIMNELNSRYSDINSYYNSFITNGSLSQSNIENIFADISYILSYENRYSKVLNFIKITYFLLIIDNNYKDIIIDRLDEASKRFYDFEHTELEYCNRKISNLKNLLKNSAVESFTFQEPFDISKISWKMKYNCQKTHVIQEYIGTSPSHGKGEFRIEGRPIFRQNEVLDNNWNHICNEFNNSIKNKIENLDNKLRLYFYIQYFNKIVFKKYIEFLKNIE